MKVYLVDFMRSYRLLSLWGALFGASHLSAESTRELTDERLREFVDRFNYLVDGHTGLAGPIPTVRLTELRLDFLPEFASAHVDELIFRTDEFRLPGEISARHWELGLSEPQLAKWKRQASDFFAIKEEDGIIRAYQARPRFLVKPAGKDQIETRLNFIAVRGEPEADHQAFAFHGDSVDGYEESLLQARDWSVTAHDLEYLKMGKGRLLPIADVIERITDDPNDVIFIRQIVKSANAKRRWDVPRIINEAAYREDNIVYGENTHFPTVEKLREMIAEQQAAINVQAVYAPSVTNSLHFMIERLNDLNSGSNLHTT